MKEVLIIRANNPAMNKVKGTLLSAIWKDIAEDGNKGFGKHCVNESFHLTSIPAQPCSVIQASLDNSWLPVAVPRPLHSACLIFESAPYLTTILVLIKC